MARSASTRPAWRKDENWPCCGCLRDGALEVEGRILRQDRSLELAKRRRWLDAELLDQLVSCQAVDAERLGLSGRPIQREHQLSPEAFTEWMFGDQSFKLSDELRMASERQFGSDPLLERGQSDLLEPLHRERDRLVSEVGERRTAPEVERLGKEACGRSRVSLCESFVLLGAPLEPLQVELLGREPDDVSGRTGLDRRRAERLAEPGDAAAPA